MSPGISRRLRKPTLKAWAWAMACLLIVKVWMPLLAMAAAADQGLPLAEVCSVYGVRTVAVDSSQAAGNGGQAGHSQDDGGAMHCPLVSLAACAALEPPAMSAVALHAPARGPYAQPPRLSALPADAAHRWLAWRLHSPPVSV